MHFRCRNCGLDQSQEQEDKELIKGHYPDGECPDCGEDIPDNATEGEECGNCGHVFW
jgi:DNA-directed RNA polymerase subunit RPC12/RpoP